MPICVGTVRKPHCWFSHEAAHIILLCRQNNERVLSTAGYDSRARTTQCPFFKVFLNRQFVIQYSEWFKLNANYDERTSFDIFRSCRTNNRFLFSSFFHIAIIVNTARLFYRTRPSRPNSELSGIGQLLVTLFCHLHI